MAWSGGDLLSALFGMEAWGRTGEGGQFHASPIGRQAGMASASVAPGLAVLSLGSRYFSHHASHACYLPCLLPLAVFLIICHLQHATTLTFHASLYCPIISCLPALEEGAGQGQTFGRRMRTCIPMSLTSTNPMSLFSRNGVGEGKEEEACSL